MLSNLLSLAALAIGLSPQGAASPPNVVLILAEDLSANLGCYGRPVATPNLDRLARMGRRFSHAYSQYPLSAPERMSLITGVRPDRLRILDAPKDRVKGTSPLQERFHAAGYFTARAGHAYAGEAEATLRWDEVAAGDEADAIVRGAAALLSAERAQPLFLTVGLPARPAPERLAAQYPVASVKLDEPSLPGRRGLPEIAVALEPAARAGRLVEPPLRPDAQRQQLLAEQYARAADVDAQVGVLLATLDRRDLWSRTIVVVAGLHGADLGGHGLLLRTDTLFEDSLRVPLIVAAPQIQEPGAAADTLVELIDIHPTLSALCGLPALDGLDGVSLEPLLLDPRRSVKSAVFSVAAREASHLGLSVRSDRFRYNEWPDGSEELYDHEADPHEFVNLARRPDQAATVAEMKKLLDLRQAAQAPAAGAPREAAPTPSGRKPNVLFMIFDDLDARLGCLGDDVKTPNIDRLAAHGRLFERAYAQVAVCSPSRTSLLTGWKPERLDIWGNATPIAPHVEGAVPLHLQFKANGYVTARTGKIFHQHFDSLFAWDEVLDLGAFPDSDDEARAGDAEPEGDFDPTHWFVATNNKDEDEPDGRRARVMARWIEAHKDAPFFAAVGFAKPHLRWVAPRKYFDLYSPDRVRFVPDPVDDLDDVPVIALASRIDRPGLFLTGNPLEFEEPVRRLLTVAHHAAVSFVDAQLGVLLDALDRLHLWDNTIVVLLGDHGFHLGEHRLLWRKDTLFEEALRAPLIIAAPGLRKPATPTRALAEFTDIYPTLTELAGLAPPPGLDGTSLVPYLQRPRAEGPKAAYSFRACIPPALGRSVRTERYRFTEWPDGSRELYDLAADPGERENLAKAPAAQAVVQELSTLLYSVVKAPIAAPKRRGAQAESP